MKPIVIFLNGTSSAGKTSLAVELQKLYREPFLHIGVDSFLFMMPDRYLFEGEEAALGYAFTRVDDEEGEKVIVHNGPYARKLNAVKRQTMKALLEENFNLIVDEVLYSDEDFAAYLELFGDYDLLFVGVKPSLEVAVRREKERGDRMVGLARGLHGIVHENKRYDLQIDTSSLSPEEAAKAIQQYLLGRAT